MNGWVDHLIGGNITEDERNITKILSIFLFSTTTFMNNIYQLEIDTLLKEVRLL